MRSAEICHFCLNLPSSGYSDFLLQRVRLKSLRQLPWAGAPLFVRRMFGFAALLFCFHKCFGRFFAATGSICERSHANAFSFVVAKVALNSRGNRLKQFSQQK